MTGWMRRIVVLWAAGLVLVVAPAARATYTASEFAVSESGDATLNVPIQVPRGIGGMEPQLSLSYTSSAGNGLLGLGWSLSGPSAISRCSKTLLYDGVRGAVTFAPSDRYCMDGERLVIIGQANSDGVYGTANSQYRTARDNFSRITALGSFNGQTTVPASFKVETKAGLILEFGLSANSRVVTNFVPGITTPQTVNRWMLQRISDRHGSFVEFFYCAGEVAADGSTCNTAVWSGSTVLHYVRYTNRDGAVNGSYAVVFGYQSRPDRVQGFHAGSAARQTQRIARIETYRDFTGPNASGQLPLSTFKLVRGYDLSYEPTESGTTSLRATNASRLMQVQERDAAGNTLPPLTFKRPADLVFDQAVTQSPSATGRASTQSAGCGGVLGGGGALCP